MKKKEDNFYFIQLHYRLYKKEKINTTFDYDNVLKNFLSADLKVNAYKGSKIFFVSKMFYFYINNANPKIQYKKFSMTYFKFILYFKGTF